MSLILKRKICLFKRDLFVYLIHDLKTIISEEIFNFDYAGVSVLFEHSKLDYPNFYQETREFWRALSVRLVLACSFSALSVRSIASFRLKRSLLFYAFVEM